MFHRVNFVNGYIFSERYVPLLGLLFRLSVCLSVCDMLEL